MVINLENNEEAKQIERQVSLLISAIFITIICITFKDTILMIIRSFLILPSWWLLLCLTLFSFVIIFSLDAQMKRINRLRLQALEDDFKLKKHAKYVEPPKE